MGRRGRARGTSLRGGVPQPVDASKRHFCTRNSLARDGPAACMQSCMKAVWTEVGERVVIPGAKDRLGIIREAEGRAGAQHR